MCLRFVSRDGVGSGGSSTSTLRFLTTCSSPVISTSILLAAGTDSDWWINLTLTFASASRLMVALKPAVPFSVVVLNFSVARCTDFPCAPVFSTPPNEILPSSSSANTIDPFNQFSPCVTSVKFNNPGL